MERASASEELLVLNRFGGNDVSIIESAWVH